MYGATYLLPLYLAQVQGYNARQIGMTIMWSGMPQLLMMPATVQLLRRFDARLLLTLGLGLFAASSFINATMTNQSAYDQLRIAQLVRAVGMPLVIVPVTTLATGIGIALLASQLDMREKVHSAHLGENVHSFSNTVGSG
jgi:DHA2 family multidrug resistance protein